MCQRAAPFEKLFVIFSKDGKFTGSLYEEKESVQPVRVISKKYTTCTVKIVNSVLQLQQPIHIGSKCFLFEVDTGTRDNFVLKKSMERTGEFGSWQGSQTL